MAAADRAVTGGVDRLIVQRVFCIQQIPAALVRERMAVAGIAARHHAVEKIDTAINALQNVGRRPDAHQIADFILRHVRLDRLDDAVHFLCRLAHREAADRVAVQIQRGDLLHMRDAQVGVGRALIDAEQKLLRVDGALRRIEAVVLRLAALERTVRAQEFRA